jgi:hypothetical protein
MRSASLGSAGSGTDSSVVWPAKADGALAGKTADPRSAPVSPADLRCGENEGPVGIATLRSVLVYPHTLPEREAAFKGGGGLFRGGKGRGGAA